MLPAGYAMKSKSLNNKLKVYRAMKDMTQADLAESVGVTRKTINTIETGRFVPSTVLALLLANTFGVKVEELFWLERSSGRAKRGRK